jgi:hypothetical protein
VDTYPTATVESAHLEICMADLIEDQFTDRAIITRHDGSEVLLIAGADGWALPQGTSRRHPADVTDLCRAMRNQLGLDTIVLRCAHTEVDANTGAVARVYELATRSSPRILASSARWFQRHEAAGIVLPPYERAALAVWLEAPAPRPHAVDGQDWTLVGWWDEATTWITQRITELGAGAIDTIEQLRAWEFSCVLRIGTERGEFYFKALPQSLAMEPRLTQRLAAVHPQWVAEIVATDPRRRWMLTRACPGAVLDDVGDLSVWERAVQSFAQLQIMWAERTAELMAAGCVDRRLARLEADIAPLLGDTAALLPNQPAGLSTTDIETLRACAPRLETGCRDLAAYAVPASIEHGDFWPGNVFADHRSCRIIDWTDACVSHPFFSLRPLLASGVLEERLAHAPDARDRIRNAYLDPWKRYETPDRLRQTFDLSQTLAAAHYAVTYWRLLPMIGTQWWLPRMVPFFLKQLLREAT